MNESYRRISQFLMTLAIATITIGDATPVWSQTNSAQPRRGDADRLRPAQGQRISPTNLDQFAPSQNPSSTSLTIQNINLEVVPTEPVLAGNYNATPQRVNKLGSFSSDPLNAIQIFQETSRPRNN